MSAHEHNPIRVVATMLIVITIAWAYNDPLLTKYLVHIPSSAVADFDEDATVVLGPDNYTNAADWTDFGDPGVSARAMVYDETGETIYAAGTGGISRRCFNEASATVCNTDLSWTGVFVGEDFLSMFLDTTGGGRVLYAGTESAKIYRCDIAALSCEDAGDWSLVRSEGVATNFSGIISNDGTLFALVDVEGSIRIITCSLASGCDADGEYSTSLPLPGSNPTGPLFVDAVNDILYAGTGGGILRCNQTSGCDEDIDWSEAVTSDSVNSIIEDEENAVLYAGTDSQILRCVISTGCDEDSDWESSFDSGYFIPTVYWESASDVLIAANDSLEALYICEITFTACDDDSDWQRASYDATVFADVFVKDTTTDTLYGAGDFGGTNYAYSCDPASGCNDVSEFGYNFGNVNGPSSIAFDAAAEKLFVSDEDPSRVLMYFTSEIVNGEYAAGVLGQADLNEELGCNRGGAVDDTTFCYPRGLAVDSGNERLFVADSGNNRVLVYDYSDGISDGEGAVNVIGQSDFTSTDNTVDQTHLGEPWGVAYDSTTDRLFVADQSHGRIMVFDVDPAVLVPGCGLACDGPLAVNVLGVDDGDESGNYYDTTGGGTSSINMADPKDVAVDEAGQRLFVSEEFNQRILVFDVDETVLVPDPDPSNSSNGPEAINVLGQDLADPFNTNDDCTDRYGIPGDDCFTNPRGISFDPDGDRLLVADQGNNRVLAFDAADGTLSNGDAASDLWGQPDFNTNDANTTQSGLASPRDVEHGSGLFVADQDNDRVLGFGISTPTPTATPASGGGRPRITGGFRPASVAINDDVVDSDAANVLVRLRADMTPTVADEKIPVNVALSNDPSFATYLVFRDTSNPKGNKTVKGSVLWERQYPWDLCFGVNKCEPGKRTVYARFYVNTEVPDPDINIAPGTTPACAARPACLDARPACAIREPPIGWCPTSAVPAVDRTLASYGDPVIRRTSAAMSYNQDWCRDDYASNPSVKSMSLSNGNSCAGTMTSLQVREIGGLGRTITIGGRPSNQIALPQDYTNSAINLSTRTVQIIGSTTWTDSKCVDIYGNHVTNVRVYPYGPGGGFQNFNTGGVQGNYNNWSTPQMTLNPGVIPMKASAIIGHGVNASGQGRGSCDVALAEWRVNVPTNPTTPTPVPTPILTSTPAPGGIPAGTLTAVCRGWPSPRIEVRWSATPPAGVTKNANSVKKGVNGAVANWFFGGDLSSPLGGVGGTKLNGQTVCGSSPCLTTNPNFNVYDLRDTAVSTGNTYAYTAKYTAGSSSNTVSVAVNSANCGGPASTGTPTPTPIQSPRPLPLSVSPDTQTVPPNVSALLSANGGTQVYSWYAADGSPTTGTGDSFTTVFTNAFTSPVQKTVYLTSGGVNATATVTVEGVQTLSDDITLTGLNPLVTINNGAATTADSSVTLTLRSPFTTNAANVTMQIANDAASVAAARSVPFSPTVTGWNLCAGVTVCEGLRGVYALFTSGSTTLPASPSFDTIVYDAGTVIPSSGLLINAGAASTGSPLVALTPTHGFVTSDTNIRARYANDPSQLSASSWESFSPARTWSLCSGQTYCASGSATVWGEFTDGIVVSRTSDTIDFTNAAPSWGVLVNNDDPSTLNRNVTLTLNPAFDLPGTTVLLSNSPDFNGATPQPFSLSVPWDICTGSSSCPDGQKTVYVLYSNAAHPEWFGYEDGIILGVALTPTPLPGSAGLLVNNGAATTATRKVSLNLSHPFSDDVGVRMRTVSADDLVPADRDIIAEAGGGVAIDPKEEPGAELFPPRLTDGGGAAPKPEPTPFPIDAGSLQQFQTAPESPQGIPGTRTLPVILDVPGALPPAITTAPRPINSGQERSFEPEVVEVDLCGNAVECPEGPYKFFAQFYKPANISGSPGVLAALDDEVSSVYVDSIIFTTATPTPTASIFPSVPPTPTPSWSPAVSSSPVSPSGSAVPAASGGPLASGAPAVGPGAGGPGIFGDIADALSGAQNVILPFAVGSAVAVAVSAFTAMASLAAISSVTPAAVTSFAWQWFMGWLGLLPRRKKTWGTVYDASTKRPVPYAKVQLLDRNKRVLETRIADSDGRYGFLTTPESLQAQQTVISIQAGVAGYSFPSRTPVTVDTFIYNNLYYGEQVTVKEDMLINFDIPLDPLSPSRAPLLLKSPSIALGASTAAIADAGFWLGLVMVPLSFIISPNPFTFGTLCLFLGTASLRAFGIREHPFGTVTDTQTGRPMPFALITLDDLSGKRIAFAVSDERGRYFIVAPHGSYRLTAFSSALVQPPRRNAQTIDVRKGWITRSLKL